MTMKSYLLPTRLFILLVVTLVIITVLQSSSAIFQLVRIKDENENDIHSNIHSPALPIKIGEVGITFNATSNGSFGLDHPADWANIFPHHGRVKLSSNKSDYDHDHDEVVSISMFHQLHCVMRLRTYLQKMIAGERLPSTAYFHVEHCTGQLSQLMLCAADITLEPSETARNRAGKRVHALDVGGVVHRCRDAGTVIQFVRDNFHSWEKEAAHFEGENDLG